MIENVDFLGLNKTMQVYQKVENGDLVGIWCLKDITNCRVFVELATISSCMMFSLNHKMFSTWVNTKTKTMLEFVFQLQFFYHV